MGEEEYLEERLVGQMKWYGKKSAANKKWYRQGQLAQIVLASLITLSGIFPHEEFPWVFYAIPLMGAMIAIISGVLGLYKFQENWIEYRTTAEALKQERYLFLTKSEPYNVDGALVTLVSRVEALLSKENNNWVQNMQGIPSEGNNEA